MAKQTPVININLDKNCKECGKQEACDNGLCMSCSIKENTKRLTATTSQTINEHMLVTALQKIQKHLFDHHLEIDKAYNNLEEDETGYKIEKLAVSLKVKFEQMGNKIAMQTEIAFSTGKVKDGEKVLIDPQQPKLGEEY